MPSWIQYNDLGGYIYIFLQRCLHLFDFLKKFSTGKNVNLYFMYQTHTQFQIRMTAHKVMHLSK